MDRRYQVFVSSTYKDLIEERQHVTQALLEMDCIPAGMEMFPAIDEDQFEFIKTIIDDCDYYLLIIAGRYGSLDAQGVSYTEKEYDYAVAKEIPVITLLHANPGSIASDKTEQSDEGKNKLAAFRKKAQDGRLSKEWKTADELAGLVSRALHTSFKRSPAVGWIRANKAASEDVLNELRELRQKNDVLTQKLASLQNEPKIEGLAPLEATFTIVGSARRFHIWHPSGNKTLDAREPQTREATWKGIFEVISPFISSGLVEQRVKEALEDSLKTETYTSFEVDKHNFKTIRIQLEAHGLIYVKLGRSGSEEWTLTNKGKALMFQFRTVKAF